MSAIEIFYASRPVGEFMIPTLEIRVPGKDPIRLCNGYEDQMLGVDGVMQKFEAGPLSIALPSKDTSGQQKLSFGFAGVTPIAQEYVDAALTSTTPSTLIYRAYLSSDKTAPATNPLVMTIVGGSFEGVDVVFEGSFYDLLNAAWPRQNYTSETAPGIRFL